MIFLLKHLLKENKKVLQNTYFLFDNLAAH